MLKYWRDPRESATISAKDCLPDALRVLSSRPQLPRGCVPQNPRGSSAYIVRTQVEATSATDTEIMIDQPRDGRQLSKPHTIYGPRATNDIDKHIDATRRPLYKNDFFCCILKTLTQLPSPFMEISHLGIISVDN